MSRGLSFLVAGAILVGCLAVAGVMVAQRPEPARRPVPSRVPFAVTAPVVAGAGAIPVHGAGTVRPRAQIDVAAEISGRVEWVAPAFQSGGRVRRGQLLFRIDDADYRNRVEQARASVAVQRVELLRVTEEARLARFQYERFRRLRNGSESAAETSPLVLWEPQLEAAEAALARDRAALAEAELRLSRTEVRAPFAGAVRTESVDVGQFVAAGEGVAQLYAADAVEVVVPLSDVDAALVPGLWELEAGNAEPRVPAGVVAEYGNARYAWAGYVDRVETALDEQTRTLDVIVRVPNPFAAGAPQGSDARRAEAGSGKHAAAGAPPLLLGMFVEVRIQGRAPDEYFRVPRPALRPGDEVWVVRDGAIHIVPVRVLQRADNDVFVTGALETGEPAVVGGIRIATEGMLVRTEAGGGS